jgi:hypothetical protein
MGIWCKRAFLANAILSLSIGSSSGTNDQLYQAIEASNLLLVKELIKQYSPFSGEEKQRLRKLSNRVLYQSQKEFSRAYRAIFVGTLLSVGTILSLAIATQEKLYVFDDGNAKGKEFDEHDFWHYIRYGTTYKSYPPATVLDKTVAEKNNERYVSFAHGLIVRGAIGAIGLWEFCKAFAQYKSYFNALRIKKLLEEF